MSHGWRQCCPNALIINQMEDDTFTKQRQCLNVQHMEEDALLTRQRQCVCSQRLNWGGSRSSSAQAEKYFYNTYMMCLDYIIQLRRISWQEEPGGGWRCAGAVGEFLECAAVFQGDRV